MHTASKPNTPLSHVDSKSSAAVQCPEDYRSVVGSGATKVALLAWGLPTPTYLLRGRVTILAATSQAAVIRNLGPRSHPR